jgi:hypothetical protein
MKLSEFVMFLKDMRLVTSECSLVEILRTYGELKGKRDFKLRVRHRLLEEKLHLIKQKFRTEEENIFGLKKDVYMEGKENKAANRSVDLLSPVHQRNRIYTEEDLQNDVGS